MPTNQVGLDYLVENQNAAEILVNEGLDKIDALIRLSIKDRDLATPPGSPAHGDRYIVATSPTGLWAGQAGKLAVWFNTAWKFFTVKEGWELWIDDENKLLVFDGSAYLQIARKQLIRFRQIRTVDNPGAAEDRSMFFTDTAITVTKLAAVLKGSASPSVTWTIRYDADRNATGTEVVTGGTTTTSTTTGSIVSSFSDPTIPANSFVWLETTAKSGTVDEMNVTVTFTEDD
jgi:hypothetical protein